MSAFVDCRFWDRDGCYCVCGNGCSCEEHERVVATTPSSNGAEGAGDENPFLEDAKRWVGFVPPQPAPDAMRTLLHEHWLTEILCDHINKTDVATCFCGYWKSAPMKSVGEAVNAWVEHVLTDCHECHGTGEKTHPEGGPQYECSDCSGTGKAVLPPSGAGAAEPVAWRCTNSDGGHVYLEHEPRSTHNITMTPLYATPPVRGDREQIERLAEIHLGAWLKSSDPALQLIPTAARQDIRDFADAILSLPSAPVSDDKTIPLDLAKVINDLSDYADDLDHTERPAIGEYDVTKDIRLVCQALVDAYHPPAPVSGRDAVIEECAKIAFNVAFAARQAIRSAKGRTKRLQAVAGEETAQQITKAIRALSNHKGK